MCCATPPGLYRGGMDDAEPHETAVRRVPVSDLYEDPANARGHPDKNIQAITDSLKRFGQTLPLVTLPDGMVVAGNGRLRAMRALGWEECDVVVRGDWSSLDAAAYAIADNRTAELAGWDDEGLRSLLDTMDDEMLEVLAFSPTDIENLTGQFDVAGVDMPELDDSDRSPFQQMTFTLHEAQALLVDEAISIAKAKGVDSVLNENTNGNALNAICHAYIEANRAG